jgi:hypothetical protein
MYTVLKIYSHVTGIYCYGRFEDFMALNEIKSLQVMNHVSME